MLMQGGVLHVSDVLRQVEVAVHDDRDVTEVFGCDGTEYVAIKPECLVSTIVIEGVAYVLVHSLAENNNGVVRASRKRSLDRR